MEKDFEEIYRRASELYKKVRGKEPPSLKEDPYAEELKKAKYGSKTLWAWATESLKKGGSTQTIWTVSEGKGSDLISPKEASEILHVNYRTLWRWAVKEGRIPYLRLPSGRLRYYRKDIERIVSKN